MAAVASAAQAVPWLKVGGGQTPANTFASSSRLTPRP